MSPPTAIAAQSTYRQAIAAAQAGAIQAITTDEAAASTVADAAQEPKGTFLFVVVLCVI